MNRKELLKRSAQYTKFVEWDPADGCFVGRCPDLFEGGVHGQDEAKVYKELVDTCVEWIALLERDGGSLPRASKPADYSGKFLVRVPPALHQRVVLKAKVAGESLNAFVARSLGKA
jgi:predicted HicB family RNase H-like nuclease